ncbi:MAG TPA: sulfotransferase domain-containing protein [Polyangiaceae bacterium LLY-WYZ-15_(1-7)]|nr:hypothetical protein [Sandaracinus sp.]HJK93021.1 sulfotransferase domain-containing protein [Polyangiaceae bacterium LLY-WYZ-15_(1-7)]HJL06148.1 sulfotransferase domain-containing protein [Polyangiaceae bacterium LLY-WYZ-15_(1-7)]HJL11803.1 sulfotransferase domain-containing protein [Polyangiaceae bacterium LLY-WYZ-15_(1-7)]HJL34412.1 sulfotransferase domain-containing protein [Polyangiaceae bacterium LLY-WYZ-15_(1-7)]
MPRLPNLVVGGAPKCGTSSLYRWLIAHPSVAGATKKETFFFMDATHSLADHERGFHVRGLAGYEDFFPESAPVIVEATTHYLYQDTALQMLPKLPSDPTVAFVLRDPVSRLRSSFQYTKHTLGRMKRELGFDEYLRALHEGRPEHVVSAFHRPRDAQVLLRDVEHGRYVRFLRRWRDALPPERLTVVTFEDFVAGPRQVLSELLARFDVDLSFYSGFSFPSANETYGVGRPKLHRVARRIGAHMSVAPRLQSALRSIYWRVQPRRPPPPSDLSKEADEHLRALYAEDTQALADEFNLDVTSWQARAARAGDDVA